MYKRFAVLLFCLTCCVPNKKQDPSVLKVFSKPMELKLVGPFALLNGSENIEKKRQNSDSWQTGELTLQSGSTLPVSLKIRGNSSIDECTFRKLKLKWDKASSEMNPLGVESNRLKIGTHCQKVAGPTKVLGNELSTLRENFLLQLYALISDVSLKSAAAQIKYVETLDKKELGSFFALLKEDEEEFALRKNLSSVTPEESSKIEHYSQASLASLILFQSLAGNTDWRIAGLGGEPFGPPGAWNIEVYRNASSENGTKGLVGVPSDLDLARTITALDNTALRPSHWIGKPLSDLSIQSSAVFSMEMLLRNLNSMPAEAILQAISNFRAIELGDSATF